MAIKLFGSNSSRSSTSQVIKPKSNFLSHIYASGRPRLHTGISTFRLHAAPPFALERYKSIWLHQILLIAKRLFLKLSYGENRWLLRSGGFRSLCRATAAGQFKTVYRLWRFFFYCAPPLTVLSCQNPPDCFHSLADVNNLASMGQLARFCSSNADEPKKNNSYRGRHFQIPHLKLIM